MIIDQKTHLSDVFFFNFRGSKGQFGSSISAILFMQYICFRNRALVYILLMYARIAAVFPSFFFAPLLSAVFCVLCHPSSRLDVPVATRNSHSSIMRASKTCRGLDSYPR